ncbi:hypothetical protein X975_13478, partial [Stegodyphus mimosarum]
MPLREADQDLVPEPTHEVEERTQVGLYNAATDPSSDGRSPPSPPPSASPSRSPLTRVLKAKKKERRS